MQKFIFGFFVLSLSLELYASSNNSKSNTLPVVKAFITLLDPQNMDKVRVNLENSYDLDGKVTRTEVDLGITPNFIETRADFVTDKYQNNFNKVFQIKAKVYDNKNEFSELTREINPNSDLQYLEVISNKLFAENDVTLNKQYNFQAQNSDLNKTFLLTLSKKARSNFLIVFFEKMLDLVITNDSHKDNLGNVYLNNILVFSEGEINNNADSFQKFVAVNKSNTLKVNWKPASKYEVDIKISEVQFVSDQLNPIASTLLVDNFATNQEIWYVNILDSSRTLSTVTINGASFETTNVVTIEAVDSFGNTTGPIIYSNIILDRTAPILTYENNESKFYTNTLPFQKIINVDSNEVLKLLQINDLTVSNPNQKNQLIDILQSGQKIFYVIAEDLAGNTSSNQFSIEVVFDDTAPIVNLNSPELILTNESERK